MPHEMPTIELGPHRVSRLIVGANPVLGYSYMGAMLGRFMLDHFTPDNTHRLLARCLDQGINTWQTSAHEKVEQALDRLRHEGRSLHWILLTSEGDDRVQDLAATVRRYHPIAVVHHGGVSDRLYREGRIAQVREFTQRVRDLGVLAGVSAHDPAVIRHVEDAGWEVDLYMTCFYRLTRTPEELQEGMREVPVWGNFLPGDPARMTEVVRQVQRPCLAFKILAGGRRAERPEDAEACFEFAFRSIKPGDGVIVGMFPRFRDEAEENAAWARRYGVA
ncbi:MAG: hypothetical protein WDA75_12175 [Candidatus Latescibacterota bacterium]|jgi:hypothetical protein